MPVSPQDYALWSYATGKPVPVDPAERMAIAPEVYSFTRNLGRRGGQPGGLRKAVDVIGKTALAAGALAGAAYLGSRGTGGQPSFVSEEPAVKTEPVEVAETVIKERPAEVVESVAEEPTPTGVQFLREKARGMGRIELMAQQAAKQASARRGVSGIYGEADPSLLKEVAARETQVEIPETGTSYPTPDVLPYPTRNIPGVSYVNRQLMLDDEPQVDNDIVAAEPLSTVGKVSKDVTAADPASDINQRVLPAQTQTRVEEGRAKPQPTTVAENLATKQSPVHAATSFVGRYSRELQEKAELARRTLAHLPLEQAMVLLGAKLPASAPTVAPETAPQAEVAPQAIEVAPVAREVKTASFSTNPYLSEMSQREGALQSYEIAPERSRAISEVTFYPGGEIGTELQNKTGSKEYVYATRDPYRQAMGMYAEEGFPSGMGSIGGIATPKADAIRLGLQRQVGPGGELVQGPLQAMAKTDKQTQALRKSLERRAAGRKGAATGEAIIPLGQTAAGAALKQKAIETIGQIAQSPV